MPDPVHPPAQGAPAPPPTRHAGLRRRLCLQAGAASLLAAAPGVRAQPARPYRFSPVNQYGIELTASYWNPLIQYASARSGVPLELKIGRTSADTTAYVLAGEVDFVFSNHLFAPEREKLGWRVFGRRSALPIRGQLLVLADSPVRRLQDLADQEVAFPGPEAVVAYKFPYAELLARGIAVKASFGGNHDGSFAQLVSGKAKATGANSQVAEGWSRREGRALRVLWESEPVHELALMASARVPQPQLAAVQKAFLEMHQDPEGRRVLASVSGLVKLPADTHFVAADASDYRAYREFYRQAPPSLR